MFDEERFRIAWSGSGDDTSYDLSDLDVDGTASFEFYLNNTPVIIDAKDLKVQRIP